jgi:hypothetical protein
MLQRTADPRTEDTIVFELLRTPRGTANPEVVGRAIFRGGRSRVDAPEAVAVAVEEQLSRAFVDRVQADERPRGYRRSGRGIVDMLVPGMPEHFIARMRGLWLSYPDGSVVTARESAGIEAVPQAEPTRSALLPDLAESNPVVTDAAVRRGTLAAADRSLQARPLVRAHAPFDGLRPEELPSGPVGRSDCGWLV